MCDIYSMYIHSQKLTWHLAGGISKTKLIFQPQCFRCNLLVSGRVSAVLRGLVQITFWSPIDKVEGYHPSSIIHHPSSSSSSSSSSSILNFFTHQLHFTLERPEGTAVGRSHLLDSPVANRTKRLQKDLGANKINDGTLVELEWETCGCSACT